MGFIERIEEIVGTLSVLHGVGALVELRTVDKGQCFSGYYTDHNLLAKHALELEKKCSGVYITAQTIDPNCLGDNVILNRKPIRAKKTTSNADILGYTNLFIDIDSKHPIDAPASPEEVAETLELANAIREYLTSLGWPKPVVATSGNGTYLIWDISLPNTEENIRLVKRILKGLRARFKMPHAEVDDTVGNPGRLIRLLGTWNKKGTASGDRPHRQSAIISWPDEVINVSEEQLRHLADTLDSEAPSSTSGTSSTPKSAETTQEILLRLVAECEFFHTPVKEPYVSLPMEGYRKVLGVNSSAFIQWLQLQFFDEQAKTPNRDILKQTLEYLAASAIWNGDEREVHLRTAQSNEAIYFDLGDKDHHVVKISRDGWELTQNSSVTFVRVPNLSEQIFPMSGEGDLLKFLNHIPLARNPDGSLSDPQILILAYLVTALIPKIPHCILILCGEKGAAKSTTAKLLRSIIDPAQQPLLAFPKSADNLVLSLSKNAMPCFDNIDRISAEHSDLLCQAATGGAISKRKLYTDTDEVFVRFHRPCVLNGINVVATRPDLLDRSIIIELQRIEDAQRKSENQVIRDFEDDKPEILAGLFSTLSKAMAIVDEVKIDHLERMADFCRWGFAVTEALGIGGDAFLTAYRANISVATNEAISANPVASAIVAIMRNRPDWEGSVTKLLKDLENEAKKNMINTISNTWPGSPSALSRQLTRVTSDLARNGLIVSKRHGGSAKMVKIENNNYKKGKKGSAATISEPFNPFEE